jgi:hypothetical protein
VIDFIDNIRVLRTYLCVFEVAAVQETARYVESAGGPNSNVIPDSFELFNPLPDIFLQAGIDKLRLSGASAARWQQKQTDRGKK